MRVAKAAHDAYVVEESDATNASNMKAAEFNRILAVYALGADGRFDMATGAVTRSVEQDDAQ